MDDYYESLKENLSQFDGFTTEETEAFLQIGVLTRYSKGDLYLREGQVSRELGYISEGLMMHYKVHDGEDIPADFTMEGQWVAYLKSFSSGEPSDMNIVALEDTVVINFRSSDLEQVFKKYPRFMAFKNQQTERALVETIRHATDLATLPARERYYKLMSEKPELIHRVPQYYLASYLGIKPQSLSRIRSESLRD